MILSSIRLCIAAVGILAFATVANAQTVSAQPKPRITNYGNWSVLCPPEGDTSGIPCAMQFSLVDKKRKVPVIVWRIGFNKKGELLADLVTPTEVMIRNGVRLTIGKAKAFTLPYVSCGLSGCESRANLSKEIIAAMKLAKFVTLTLATTSGKPLQLKLDVSGLGNALAAIGVP